MIGSNGVALSRGAGVVRSTVLQLQEAVFLLPLGPQTVFLILTGG